MSTRIGVDDLFHTPDGRGPWCHMLCDDFTPHGLAALHAFARQIGLSERAYHTPSGQPRPHYDLTPPFREKALECGAQTLSRRQVVEFLTAGRQSLEPKADPDARE